MKWDDLDAMIGELESYGYMEAEGEIIVCLIDRPTIRKKASFAEFEMFDEEITEILKENDIETIRDENRREH